MEKKNSFYKQELSDCTLKTCKGDFKSLYSTENGEISYIFIKEKKKKINNTENILRFCYLTNLISIYVSVPTPTENAGDVRLFDLAKSVHWIVEEGGGIGLKRRKRIGLGLDGSDDEDMNLPPTNDIYRQRQQKRVK